RTSHTRIVSMCLAEVSVQQRFKSARTFRTSHAHRFRASFRESFLQSLGDQLIARVKMSVEPAVGQFCRLHELSNAEPVQSQLADLNCGCIQDTLPTFRFVCLGMAHLVDSSQNNLGSAYQELRLT